MLCLCGCGRTTPLATRTSTRDGTVRGQHVRFMKGHRPLAPRRVIEKKCACGTLLIATKQSREFCDACQKARSRESGRKHQKASRAKSGHKEKYRAWSLRKKYKMTLEDFHDRLAAQNGACAICKRTDPGWRKDWHIDHDHKTERVRGILCQACNLLLGMSKDNIELLQNAIEYLKMASHCSLRLEAGFGA